MFTSYIKSIVECLQRCPDVPAKDITVACFGAALQLHVPHCVALFGPNLRWEIWRENAKFAPLFQEHLSNKVQQHVGTTTDYLLSVHLRPERRFICLVDMDINTTEHAFRLHNHNGVVPSTVETENHFYNSFTGPYAHMCRAAAAMPNELVLSMPFRPPWHTTDFETNKRRAVWTQADESMLHPHVDTFTQYNARPRSSEVRALCWCSGNGVREERVDWKQLDVDMATYNKRRRFLDHDKLHALMLEYEACAAGRAVLFENESSALQAWRAEFVRNSVAFAEENAAHEAHAALDEAPVPAKLVRFSDRP